MFMPYLLLIIGLIIGLIALYRFFLNATVKNIKAFFLVTITVCLTIAIILLAITGRLPAAMAVLVACIPVGLGLIKSLKDKDKTFDAPQAVNNREEAYEILGLKNDATPEEINTAYKKLISKVHPDHEGSQWLAAKLNQARDILLKDL